jgi:hypothetical protein
MPLAIIGHAIVSVDGRIADAAGEMPGALRNEADWRRFQRRLDEAALVVVGRLGHRRHPNPGRRRLVATRSVAALSPDPQDARASLWNPAGLDFDAALASLGVAEGVVAVAGVFDLLLDRFTAFDLAEHHALALGPGLPCFAGGHPRQVLASAGLRPAGWEMLDPAGPVSLTEWRREAAP